MVLSVAILANSSISVTMKVSASNCSPFAPARTGPSGGAALFTGGCCPPHGPGRTSAGCTRRPAPAAQRSAGRRRFCSWGASFRGFVVQDKGLTGGRALEHQLAVGDAGPIGHIG